MSTSLQSVSPDEVSHDAPMRHVDEPDQKLTDDICSDSEEEDEYGYTTSK